MRHVVEPLPGRAVRQPEVRAEVDDQLVGPELLNQRGGGPVRQREEHHIGVGEQRRVAGRHDLAGVGDQVRVHRGDRFARAGVGLGHDDVELGVRGKQAQQFAARVAARSGNRRPHTHDCLLRGLIFIPCSAISCVVVCRRRAIPSMQIRYRLLTERANGLNPALGQQRAQPGVGEVVVVLGLCMIVKDEAHVIERCLESVRNQTSRRLLTEGHLPAAHRERVQKNYVRRRQARDPRRSRDSAAPRRPDQHLPNRWNSPCCGPEGRHPTGANPG